MNESAIRLHIEPLDEGGFLATSPDVPGLVAEGRSVTEAAEIAQGLARKIAESCIEHGDPLPRALAILSKRMDLLTDRPNHFTISRKKSSAENSLQPTAAITKSKISRRVRRA